MTADRYRQLRRAADARRAEAAADPVPTITIGLATCGTAAGAIETRQAFEQTLAERGLQARIRTVGCNGHCYAEPFVVIDHPDSGFPPIAYAEVTPGKARMLTKLFVEEGDPRLEHVLGATVENDLVPWVMEYPRFQLESRVLLEKCGRIDPEDIYDYIAEGGYAALAAVLGRRPEDAVQLVEASGLRGRGGAGFPTGAKWQKAARQHRDRKWVICNADEGDPGAYMDRTILESNPHQVLEGLLICAYAVGADHTIVYVRAEYPLAVETVSTAIAQAAELGLVGQGILGSAFDCDVQIFEGSGAFVCGEETALIRSIEGFRGTPEHRPPYPAESGLDNDPTVINNVKTLAAVPPIVHKGPDWFRTIGTPASPGTTVFSVVGDVTHPGLVEVAMGTTLRTLIYDMCGGIPGRKEFKAVQIGGPSGGCLPESYLDVPIDYDALSAAGAMLGSGGLVVMNTDNCMVDVARYFIDFTQKESCGKCTFCRIGTAHMLAHLKRITAGDGRPEDLKALRQMGEEIRDGSLCGLGRTAPNPVLTSLAHFHPDYEAHVLERCCPGKVCRPLVAYYIDLDKCARGCDICVGCCPVDAVFTTRNRKKGIDPSLCVKCGECMVACPPQYDAVRKVSPAHLAPVVERPEEKRKESNEGPSG